MLQVHSEYQFRRDVSNRTVEDDKQVKLRKIVAYLDNHQSKCKEPLIFERRNVSWASEYRGSTCIMVLIGIQDTDSISLSDHVNSFYQNKARENINYKIAIRVLRI